MGSYTQIWSKMQILESYAEFEGFAHIAGRYNLPPSQPRFLARLPRWQKTHKMYSMLPSIRTVPVSGHLKQKLNF